MHGGVAEQGADESDVLFGVFADQGGGVPPHSSRLDATQKAQYARALGVDPHVETELLEHVTSLLAAPLPEDWRECLDGRRRIFYYNTKTVESSWAHPLFSIHAALAEAFRRVIASTDRTYAASLELEGFRADGEEKLAQWREVQAAEGGRSYFYHVQTFETRWENPRDQFTYELGFQAQMLSRLITRQPFIARVNAHPAIDEPLDVSVMHYGSEQEPPPVPFVDDRAQLPRRQEAQKSSLASPMLKVPPVSSSCSSAAVPAPEHSAADVTSAKMLLKKLPTDSEVRLWLPRESSKLQDCHGHDEERTCLDAQLQLLELPALKSRACAIGVDAESLINAVRRRDAKRAVVALILEQAWRNDDASGFSRGWKIELREAAAMWIQAAYRGFAARRLYRVARSRSTAEATATSTVQRVCRTYVGKRYLGIIRAALLLEQQRNASAVTIQCALRCRKAKREMAKRAEAQSVRMARLRVVSLISIQTFAKIWAARRMLVRRASALHRLRADCRRHVARAALLKLAKEAATAKLSYLEVNEPVPPTQPGDDGGMSDGHGESDNVYEDDDFEDDDELSVPPSPTTADRHRQSQSGISCASRSSHRSFPVVSSSTSPNSKSHDHKSAPAAELRPKCASAAGDHDDPETPPPPPLIGNVAVSGVSAWRVMRAGPDPSLPTFQLDDALSTLAATPKPLPGAGNVVNSGAWPTIAEVVDANAPPPPPHVCDSSPIPPTTPESLHGASKTIASDAAVVNKKAGPSTSMSPIPPATPETLPGASNCANTSISPAGIDLQMPPPPPHVGDASPIAPGTPESLGLARDDVDLNGILAVTEKAGPNSPSPQSQIGDASPIPAATQESLPVANVSVTPVIAEISHTVEKSPPPPPHVDDAPPIPPATPESSPCASNETGLGAEPGFQPVLDSCAFQPSTITQQPSSQKTSANEPRFQQVVESGAFHSSASTKPKLELQQQPGTSSELSPGHKQQRLPVDRRHNVASRLWTQLASEAASVGEAGSGSCAESKDQDAALETPVETCLCGHVCLEDAIFCRKCGLKKTSVMPGARSTNKDAISVTLETGPPNGEPLELKPEVKIDVHPSAQLQRDFATVPDTSQAKSKNQKAMCKGHDETNHVSHEPRISFNDADFVRSLEGASERFDKVLQTSHAKLGSNTDVNGSYMNMSRVAEDASSLQVSSFAVSGDSGIDISILQDVLTKKEDLSTPRLRGSQMNVEECSKQEANLDSVICWSCGGALSQRGARFCSSCGESQEAQTSTKKVSECTGDAPRSPPNGLKQLRARSQLRRIKTPPNSCPPPPQELCPFPEILVSQPIRTSPLAAGSDELPSSPTKEDEWRERILKNCGRELRVANSDVAPPSHVKDWQQRRRRRSANGQEQVGDSHGEKHSGAPDVDVAAGSSLGRNSSIASGTSSRSSGSDRNSRRSSRSRGSSLERDAVQGHRQHRKTRECRTNAPVEATILPSQRGKPEEHRKKKRRRPRCEQWEKLYAVDASDAATPAQGDGVRRGNLRRGSHDRGRPSAGDAEAGGGRCSASRDSSHEQQSPADHSAVRPPRQGSRAASPADSAVRAKVKRNKSRVKSEKDQVQITAEQADRQIRLQEGAKKLLLEHQQGAQVMEAYSHLFDAGKTPQRLAQMRRLPGHSRGGISRVPSAPDPLPPVPIARTVLAAAQAAAVGPSPHRGKSPRSRALPPIPCAGQKPSQQDLVGRSIARNPAAPPKRGDVKAHGGHGSASGVVRSCPALPRL